MIAFSIGPINVYRYGIFYLVGFLVGYGFLYMLGKMKVFAKYKKLQELLYKNTDDILISIVLGVLLGGRLGEVFIYQWEYYSTHLMQIFAVWHGGMSFVGGIVGVLLSLLILKRIKKLNIVEFLFLLDSIVAILPLAIFIGRFGNYLNQELYGLVVPENFWGLSAGFVSFLKSINIFHVYSSIDNFLRINTNFLSMIFEGFILFLITGGVMIYRIFSTIKDKVVRMSPGFIVGLFLVFYSLFRFFLEYFRVDSQSQYVGIFTISQLIFILFFVIGWLFLLKSRKISG